MAAQEDSLLSPITAADRLESTTLLVAKVSFNFHTHFFFGIHHVYDDASRRPPIRGNSGAERFGQKTV
jgi:hypothetical protein